VSARFQIPNVEFGIGYERSSTSQCIDSVVPALTAAGEGKTADPFAVRRSLFAVQNAPSLFSPPQI
jgi:hypothetical protein